MAGLTIKTVFQAVNKMTSPITTMQSQVGKFASAANHATKGISAGFGRLRGVIAGALGGLTVYKALQGIESFATKGDDISDVAKRLGLSAEALQEFQFAAKMADLTAEDLTGVMQKMNNNLGQLKAGTGTLYTNLTKTNPQLARQLKIVKNSDDAFTLLMDAIAKETNVAKRAALAQAAFGKSGQAIIDMAGDLNEKRKEARASGAIISNADVEAAQRMHNSILRLKSSGMGLLNNVLGRIAQALAPILEKWAKWVSANRELIGQKIDEVIDKICRAVKMTYDIFTKVNDLMGGHLVRNLAIMVVSWKAVAAAITLAKVAQVAFNLASGGKAAGAAAGVAAKAVAGTAAGSGILSGLSLLPVAGAAAVVGRGILPMMMNPTGALEASRTGEKMEGGNLLTNLFTKMYGLGAGIRGDSKPAHVVIDFTNMPAGVTAGVAGSSSGAPAVTLQRGSSLRGINQ